MKILHIENTAGVASIIAKAQNEIGHEAHVLETWRRKGSNISFPHDFENYYEGPTIPFKMLRTVMTTRPYDIIHLHGGIARKRIDISIIKRIWKQPLVVHYHGSETRMGYGLHGQNLIDSKIVATPDLLDQHPKATYIPIPQGRLPFSFSERAPTHIIHAPTNRQLKGTDLILNAIDILSRRTDGFVFELVENVTHEEMLKKFRQAHIYIDRVISEYKGQKIGTMGVAPLEAMSSGCAMVMHINPEFVNYYQGCPVINVEVSPVALADTLERIIQDRGHLFSLATRGSEYVANERNPLKIARMIDSVYDRCFKKTRGG